MPEDGKAELNVREPAEPLVRDARSGYVVYKCARKNAGLMSTPTTTLTVRLRPEVKDQLAELAHRTRRTSSFLAGEAIADYVARELEIVEKINEGLEDVRAGRVVSHEQVMDETQAIIEAAKKTDR
jgi:predicted transcriptional regulator